MLHQMKFMLIDSVPFYKIDLAANLEGYRANVEGLMETYRKKLIIIK
jgi:hypothetical protein